MKEMEKNKPQKTAEQQKKEDEKAAAEAAYNQPSK